jgi:PKD repeat protein
VMDSVTGCTDTMSRSSYVSVGGAVAACFTAPVTNGCAPALINYVPCSSGAISYIWNFPGGSPATVTATTAATQQVRYVNPGVYTSQLIVFYQGGCVIPLRELIMYLSAGHMH